MLLLAFWALGLVARSGRVRSNGQAAVVKARKAGLPASWIAATGRLTTNKPGALEPVQGSSSSLQLQHAGDDRVPFACLGMLLPRAQTRPGHCTHTRDSQSLQNNCIQSQAEAEGGGGSLERQAS
jgi:hypothetical protein